MDPAIPPGPSGHVPWASQQELNCTCQMPIVPLQLGLVVWPEVSKSVTELFIPRGCPSCPSWLWSGYNQLPGCPGEFTLFSWLDSVLDRDYVLPTRPPLAGQACPRAPQEWDWGGLSPTLNQCTFRMESSSSNQPEAAQSAKSGS